VEGLAVVEGDAPHEVEGLVDHPLVHDHQERHVPDVVLGRPAQEVDGVRGAHERAQPLARPVPVDEEDQA